MIACSISLDITHIIFRNTMATPLCGKCRRIDFNALRGPSAAEVRDLYADRHTTTRSKNDSVSRINLGNFQRLRQAAPECGLCSLFCHIIERQGAIGISGRLLDANDVCFVATAGDVSSYFGKIGAILPIRAPAFVLQRLTITAHESLSETTYGDCVAYLPHVLHPRIPGSIDVPIHGKTHDTGDVSEAMLFGARSRPLQLDISLLRSWIEICKNEHGSRCVDSLGWDTGKSVITR